MPQISIASPLIRRLLIYTVVCGSIFSIFTSGIQLFSNYNDEISSIKSRLVELEGPYRTSIAHNIWVFNNEHINQLMTGIVSQPDISYIEIKTSTGESYEQGAYPQDEDRLTHHISLAFNNESLGEMTIVASLKSAQQRFRAQIFKTLISQFAQTLLIAIAVLFIVHRLITRHLSTMSDYTQTLNINNLDNNLTLDRKGDIRDELYDVVAALNKMRKDLKKDISRRRKAELEVIEVNNNLENLVEQRTRQLEQANAEMTAALQSLTETKDQLVQSEKMAALGGLVSGISHEINTPIGVAITAITAIQGNTTELQSALESESLSLSQLVKALTRQEEATDMIERNLIRASELINSFKQVSVDQTSEANRVIRVSQYLRDVTNTLTPILKRGKATMTLDCDEQISIETYPGIWHQIISNLVQNSLIHGFNDGEPHHINLNVSADDTHLTLVYTDDGKGIAEDIHNKIFEPFFTTQRNKGNTGLGMHIIFNLVTNNLQGRINCDKVDSGAQFTIKVPIVIKH